MSTATRSFRLTATLDAVRETLAPTRPEAAALEARAEECEELAERDGTPEALRTALLRLSCALMLCALHRAAGDGWREAQARAVRAWVETGEIAGRVEG